MRDQAEVDEESLCNCGSRTSAPSNFNFRVESKAVVPTASKTSRAFVPTVSENDWDNRSTIRLQPQDLGWTEHYAARSETSDLKGLQLRYAIRNYQREPLGGVYAAIDKQLF